MRKTIERPAPISLIAALYLLSPVLHLAIAALNFDLTIQTAWGEAVIVYGWLGAMLVVMSPLVGLGIHSGRKWGFALFFTHGSLLLINSIWILVISGTAAPVAILLCIDAIVVVVAGYMLGKDTRAPYMANDGRGWRQRKRLDCELPARMLVGDRTIAGTTINVSTHGALVRCAGTGLTVGQEATLTLTIGADDFVLRVETIRADPEVVALSIKAEDRRRGIEAWQRVRVAQTKK